MSQIVLQAEPRTTGQNAAKELRRNDRIPGVYYANNQDPIHFSVQKLALRPVVYTAEAKTVRLEVNGKGLVCILKDVTFDPVTDKILHIDLLGVAAGETIAIEIPIHVIGLAIGVTRDGGVLEHVMHKAHVRVDPTTMPEHIDVDVSKLGKGEAIHISDLNIPGVEFTGRPDALIVACHAPKAAPAADDAAATAKK
ncbi:MAG: 50S ribosomal protein L25 [Candidatus Kapabacteria bacterium]|nr:50S ribosomal protein L25 [Candidatus Kapabacteria bacterium]